MRFIIALRGTTWIKGRRRFRTETVLYLTGVNWEESGYKAKKIQYAAERNKAITFAKLAAESLVEDLTSKRWGKYASVFPESVGKLTPSDLPPIRVSVETHVRSLYGA